MPITPLKRYHHASRKQTRDTTGLWMAGKQHNQISLMGVGWNKGDTLQKLSLISFSADRQSATQISRLAHALNDSRPHEHLPSEHYEFRSSTSLMDRIPSIPFSPASFKTDTPDLQSAQVKPPPEIPDRKSGCLASSRHFLPTATQNDVHQLVMDVTHLLVFYPQLKMLLARRL